MIGSRLPIGEAELKSRQERFSDGDPLDYLPGDRTGKTGVERSYNRYLRGLRGERRIITNRRGEVIDTQIVRPPQVGRDVVLTLHLPLQEVSNTFWMKRLSRHRILLKQKRQKRKPSPRLPSVPAAVGRGGAIVALDVHTGEVLAAVSAPRFDLNLFGLSQP